MTNLLLLLLLVGCSNNNVQVIDEVVVEDVYQEEEAEKVNISGEKLFTLSEAEYIANLILSEELKTQNYKIVFDSEVEFEEYNFFRDDLFYRFIIQAESNIKEYSIYVNKRTGVPIVYYPDNTYKQVRDDNNLSSKKLLWIGDYFKTEWDWDNCYSRLSVSSSKLGEDYLYIGVDSYFGRGSYRLHFDAQIVSENKAVYVFDDGSSVEFNLNSDNTISTVVNGDEGLMLALGGNFY